MEMVKNLAVAEQVSLSVSQSECLDPMESSLADRTAHKFSRWAE
jgi:hypothetical protein